MSNIKVYSCKCPLGSHKIDLNIVSPVWEYVVETIESLGENVKVKLLKNGEAKTYLVPRVYIAFHGLKGKDLPSLDFPIATDDQ